MDRANIAQKLLQSVMTEERASEVIGDFLETHSPSALTPFNLAFVRLLVSFAWRPITALLQLLLPDLYLFRCSFLELHDSSGSARFTIPLYSLMRCSSRR